MTQEHASFEAFLEALKSAPRGTPLYPEDRPMERCMGYRVQGVLHYVNLSKVTIPDKYRLFFNTERGRNLFAEAIRFR